MKDRTKWEYADTLIELMKHKPLNKVTVAEICRHCDTRPQNFYYHFKDKYDLVAWVYSQDIEAVTEANLDKPWSEVLRMDFEKLMSRQNFYKKAFSDDSANALIENVIAYQIRLYRGILHRKGIEPDESLAFAIEYHAYACAHITKKWLSGHEPMIVEKLTSHIMAAMPDKLRVPLEQSNG